MCSDIVRDSFAPRAALYHQDIERARKLIASCMELLETEMASNGSDSELQKTRELLWGAKESVLSSLVKLTQLLAKLIPLDRELHEGSAASAPEGEESESHEIMWDVIDHYRDRHKPD